MGRETDLTLELHEYLEGPHYSSVGPHPITTEDLPKTLGHESTGSLHSQYLLIGGTVLKVRSNVTDIKPGNKVSVYPLLYDGSCAQCKAAHPNTYENLGFCEISGWAGGLSEAVSVNRDHVRTYAESAHTSPLIALEFILPRPRLSRPSVLVEL